MGLAISRCQRWPDRGIHGSLTPTVVCGNLALFPYTCTCRIAMAPGAGRRGSRLGIWADSRMAETAIGQRRGFSSIESWQGPSSRNNFLRKAAGLARNDMQKGACDTKSGSCMCYPMPVDAALADGRHRPQLRGRPLQRGPTWHPGGAFPPGCRGFVRAHSACWIRRPLAGGSA